MSGDFIEHYADNLPSYADVKAAAAAYRCPGCGARAELVGQVASHNHLAVVRHGEGCSWMAEHEAEQ